MVETKTYKANTLVIASAIIIVLILLFIIVGNVFSPKTVSTTPISVPTQTGNDNSPLVIITAIAFLSAAVMAYYYFFNKKDLFNNEIALALVRNYAYKHCNRLIIDDSLQNMFVEFMGNSVFFYFKDINVTFRLDQSTRFISHNKITLTDAVRTVERSELLKNVVSGSSLKDVLLAELQKKGIDKSNAESEIAKIESHILAG